MYWPRNGLSDTPFVPDVLGIRQPPEMHDELVTVTQIHRVLHHNGNKLTAADITKYYYMYHIPHYAITII